MTKQKDNGIHFHGECRIIRADLLGVTEVPEGFKKVEGADSNGHLMVAHSESGHDHYLEAAPGAVEIYEHAEDPEHLVRWMWLASTALLKHRKPESDPQRHGTQKINQGGERQLYRISIDREATTEGLWRRVED